MNQIGLHLRREVSQCDHVDAAHDSSLRSTAGGGKQRRLQQPEAISRVFAGAFAFRRDFFSSLLPALVPPARSNSTAFQAVSFQQVASLLLYRCSADSQSAVPAFLRALVAGVETSVPMSRDAARRSARATALQATFTRT